MQSINPVISFEILVNDLERACQFYQNVFNVDIRFAKTKNSTIPEIAIMPSKSDWHGIAGSLRQTSEPISPQSSILIYFYTHDINQTLEKVLQNQGEIISNDFTMAIIKDTEGNRIGIYEINENF